MGNYAATFDTLESFAGTINREVITVHSWREELVFADTLRKQIGQRRLPENSASLVFDSQFGLHQLLLGIEDRQSLVKGVNQPVHNDTKRVSTLQLFECFKGIVDLLGELEEPLLLGLEVAVLLDCR